MSREKRTWFSPATISNLTLLAIAAAFAWYHLGAVGVEDRRIVVIVLGVAGTAFVMMMVLSGLTPSLYGDSPPVFPRTLTLPIVYCALLLLCVWAWTSSGNSLVRPLEPLESTLFWASPTVLLLLATLQFLGLTLVGSLQRFLARKGR